MHFLETFTFGEMLNYLRTRRTGKPARDIVRLFDRSSPNWLSDWENNKTHQQPSLDLVRRFGAVYGLEERSLLFSYLLRAADYPVPIDQIVTGLGVQYNRLVDETTNPACVLDFHYRFIAGNKLFTQLCAPAAGAPTDLHGLSSIPRGLSGHSSETLITDGSSGVDLSQDLTLSVGFPFLLLVFSRHSPLRASTDPKEWRKLARYFVTRFWATTLPLIRPSWYEDSNPDRPGEPPWVTVLLRMLESLPYQAGTDFRRESDAARYQVQMDAQNMWSELTDEALPDTTIYWHGPATRFRVSTHDISDGRFTLYQFSPIEGTSFVQ